MNAAEFIKQRVRIHQQPGRGPQWRARALAQLVKQARAVPVYAGGKVVSYTLPNGQVVCTKQRFRDQAGAESYLDGLTLFEGTRAKHPQRVYRCPNCSGWHLTSQNKRGE